MSKSKVWKYQGLWIVHLPFKSLTHVNFDRLFRSWRDAYDYAYRNTPIPAKETWQS
jgi:hypothetical protein